jgi:hypothetical protein
MPRLSNANQPPAQVVVDLLASTMGLLNTIYADCEGDLSRYRDEYRQSINNLNDRWERLLAGIYAPDQPPAAASRPFPTYSTPVEPPTPIDTSMQWVVVDCPQEPPDEGAIVMPPERPSSEDIMSPEVHSARPRRPRTGYIATSEIGILREYDSDETETSGP